MKEHGKLYSDEEIVNVFGGNNTFLGSSVLISNSVDIGKDNVFHPNVVMLCEKGGHITIGDGNTFYPGTFIHAQEGSITIHNNNEFGPAGCTIRANMPGARITVGSGGRYTNGANILGNTSLGDGSQVLGTITLQECTMDSGEPYTHPDPDLRAPVLKGSGLARNIKLAQGQVINTYVNFSDIPIEQQSSYHPKPKAL